MRYAHTNLVARDWQALSCFYRHVFGCRPAGRRDLSGDWVDRLTGIPGAHLVGEHLALPGYEGTQGPTLEIFSYAGGPAAPPHALNAPGFGHIAFEAEDVAAMAQKVLDHGGAPLGQMVHRFYEGIGEGCFVYMRDPEGNILELQSWKTQSEG